MLSYLKSRKNLILEGSSGVGKTFIARQLAWYLAGARDASRTAMVQLHEPFAYNDFVRGRRPCAVRPRSSTRGLSKR